jgi:hypothetical protein
VKDILQQRVGATTETKNNPTHCKFGSGKISKKYLKTNKSQPAADRSTLSAAQICSKYRWRSQSVTTLSNERTSFS